MRNQSREVAAIPLHCPLIENARQWPSLPADRWPDNGTTGSRRRSIPVFLQEPTARGRCTTEPVVCGSIRCAFRSSGWAAGRGPDIWRGKAEEAMAEAPCPWAAEQVRSTGPAWRAGRSHAVRCAPGPGSTCSRGLLSFVLDVLRWPGRGGRAPGRAARPAPPVRLSGCGCLGGRTGVTALRPVALPTLYSCLGFAAEGWRTPDSDCRRPHRL